MKRAITVLLAFAMVLAVASVGVGTASAASKPAKEAADALNKLGLFSGVGTNADGTPNYDLDGAANRQTAATMLVRIIGKEAEAKSGGNTCVFTDVDGWAKNNVGWAYANGLVSGYNSSTFGGRDNITAQQYLCMVLRSLGYKDSGSVTDFTYSGACSFAKDIGLTDGSYTNNHKNFNRGDIAIISNSALNTKIKGSNSTLYDSCFNKASKPAASKDPEKNDEPEKPKNDGTGNSAPGTLVSKSGDGQTVVDYSNTADGYVMIKTTQSGDPKLVVQITGPGGTTYKYFYTSSKGVYEAFPLSDGSGTYKIGVYRNTSGTKYTTLHSVNVKAQISNDRTPYLRANFFVNYTKDSQCVKKAATLCKGVSDELDKVAKVYAWVVDYFSYDYDKAASVQSGYRPVLDTVYKAKKGICFDYAATMTAMLRSQGVPTRLMVGYAGDAYHAWISVYTEASGWVESVIYFDGSSWRLMDPTFASTGKGNDAITKYITDPSNYSAKYAY